MAGGTGRRTLPDQPSAYFDLLQGRDPYLLLNDGCLDKEHYIM